MECQEIRKKLSAYREGMVSPEEQELMEQHLASCRPCSTALNELDRAGEALKNLKEVEPPPWMKQRIMARVREEAEQKKGFLRKVFYPLHVKVPLEAFATVLIAVVAVYVFRAVEPQMKDLQVPSPSEPMIARQGAPYPAKAPAAETVAEAGKALSSAESERTKAAALEQTEKDSKLAGKKDLALPAPPPASPAAEPKKETFAGRSAETPGIADSRIAQPPSPPPAYAPAPPKREARAPEHAEPAGTAEPRRAQEPPEQAAATARRPRQEEGLSATGSAARDAQELKKTRATAPSLGAVAKEKAQAMGLKIRAEDIRGAGAEAIGLLNQMGARAIARESREAAEIITAEVKREKVKELIERLKSIGEVEEKDAPLDSIPQDATLRIEIVPPR